MKVCHIGFSRYPGIGSIAMYEYSRNLSLLGVDVCVVAAGETTGEKLIDGVRVFFMKSPSVTNLSFYPLFFVLKCISYLRRVPDNEFDIIHVYHFPFSSLLPFLFRSKSKKWVFFTTSGPVRGSLISFLGWKLQTLESWIFDHVILRDEAHKTQFSYRDENTITIVPIGADLEFFHDQKSTIREKYGIDPERFLFIYAGSLSPVRKIETLIDSLQTVLMHEKATLMVIGNGGTERVREYAQQKQLEDHVIFTGEVPYDQVPIHLAAADCFISYVPITPEFDIQPPLKTVEALATGLPVIATNTLGNRRFICDGENGVLTGDDAPSISSAMLLMMRDASLREKVQNNARKSVEEHDWKKIVSQKLLPAYERILT
jgi:glycosyltransferase involved in cell wall biosynthesis